MKVVHKIILLICTLVLIIGGLIYDAHYKAPSRYNVRYETLSSIFIPKQLDDVSILFFSDLDYNHFMNEDRLNKLTNKINSLSPDVIIFGGDIFDQDCGNLNDETKETVIKYLKSLNAPLGKFAVYGDLDHRSTQMEDTVNEILYASNFEVLNNKAVMLRNNGSQSISLIGLDSGLYGNQDITNAYKNVSRTNYTITICHTPDTADEVPSDITNYFLAGHSHGGQVNYGFKAKYIPKMAEHYTFGKHKINDRFTLDITNGVGTTVEDVRFLADAEIVMYRLNHVTPISE